MCISLVSLQNRPLQVELLLPKLDEMTAGSNLVLCRFPLPPESAGWRLEDAEGENIDAAWRYKRLEC